MRKSAQATAFILIGALIIASFLILTTAKKETAPKLETEMEKVQIDDSNVRAFVQSCVDTTAKNAVFYLGFVGGNLKNDVFPQFFTHDSYYRIPYYYYEGNSFILSEDGFKKLVLAAYMNENLRKCTNNFRAFENIRIVDSAPKTIVDMSDSEVIFSVTGDLKPKTLIEITSPMSRQGSGK